jgi:site-specific DNA recombinase
MHNINNNTLAKNNMAVIYARVSSKEQEKEGFSIPSQLKLLNEYAAKLGLIVEKEFIDVETAKRSGRTGFTEMVAFFKKNPKIKTLLVEKTDRLYRNLKDWVILEEFNLEIHLVKENAILSDNSRSSEKFMHGIKVLMAKNYIDNLSEETKKGMLEKAEQGIWPSFAPMGYKNVQRDDGKKIIVIDDEVAPLISKIYEWYATSTYSVKEVTRKAKEYGMSFRKSNNPLPQATVHKILRNRLYSGDFEWNSKIYRGSHEPIVDKDLWEHNRGYQEAKIHLL